MTEVALQNGVNKWINDGWSTDKPCDKKNLPQEELGDSTAG